MEELKQKMLGILDRKIAEEKKMFESGLQGKPGHSILIEEIKDAGAIIRGIDDGEPDRMDKVGAHTTSGSILKAIKEYRNRN